MAKRRAKSLNDISNQLRRIQSLARQSVNAGGDLDTNFARYDNARKTAARYGRNIRNTNAFDKDGGNNTMNTSNRPYSRKYVNYQTAGKASAVG